MKKIQTAAFQEVSEEKQKAHNVSDISLRWSITRAHLNTRFMWLISHI